jgi:Na+-driven multidrug efflux pump
MAPTDQDLTTRNIEPLPYLKTFALFALSMILNRLIRQTDLSFLSYFDPNYLNIFAYLNRMSWLESMVMFALVPLIIKIIYQHQHSPILGQLLHAILILSGLTMIGASLVYATAILGTGLHNDSMMYLYGAAYQVGYIPLILTITFLHMALFSLGYGGFVLKLTLFKLGLNVVLDAFFMHYLGLGFHGVFVATYGVYLFTLGMLWIKLKQHHQCLIPRSTLRKSIAFVRGQAHLVGYESLRLLASLLLIHILFYLAYNNWPKSDFAQFSAAHEFLFLTNLFSVALLRVTTMYLESHTHQLNQGDLLCQFRNSSLKLLGFGLVMSTLYASFQENIAKFLYNIQDTSAVWESFFSVFILYYPLSFLTSLVLAVFHVHNELKTVTQIDVFCRWGLQLPLAAWGLVNHAPWVVWLAMLISELMIISLGILAWRKHQDNLANELTTHRIDS